MERADHFTRFYLPVLIYMAAIFIFSCFHKVPLPQSDKLSTDKIYHVIEYGVLGYLMLRALHKGFSGRRWGLMILLTFIAGTAYGVSDEIHQYFTPGRFFSYWDMAADSAGTLLGCWIYRKIKF